MSQYYESPYRYQEGMKLSMKSGNAVTCKEIQEMAGDSTLSVLDITIMQRLYCLHFASRSMLEQELTDAGVRMPKDLKRTLQTLTGNGVLRGLSCIGSHDADANIRFYTLSKAGREYMAANGGVTDFPYEEPITGERVLSIMAYNQLADALRHSLSGRIISHTRQYALTGGSAPVTCDGYMEIRNTDILERLYIRVVRSAGDWWSNTCAWYRGLMDYTAGIPACFVLFLCEDGQQVSALSGFMEETFAGEGPRRYYSYDVLIDRTLDRQRVISADKHQAVYGHLSL